MFYPTVFDADSEYHIGGDLGRDGGPHRSLLLGLSFTKVLDFAKFFFFFFSRRGRNQTVDSNLCFIKYFLILIPKIRSPKT
jgi:hypothetical protein